MITIRKASIIDVTKLVVLWKEMLSFHHKLNEIYDFIADDKAFESCILEYIGKESTMLLIAESGDQLLGYIQLRKIHRPPIFRLRIKGCIEGLYIAEAHRKSKAGSMLVDEAKKWLVDADFIELYTIYGNHAAENFWKSNGFNEKIKGFLLSN